jgi:hypothetical protein
MQQLLTNYLIEKKTCPLPGIGVLTIEHNSAWYDVANKLMHPPEEKITFNEFGIANANQLVTYIASAKGMDKDSANSMLTAFCNSWLQKLDSYEPMKFGSLGTLQKNKDGKINFINDTSLSFLDPVPAERVIHKDKVHSVLVGDKETTSSVMTEYYKETVVTNRKPWLAWAAALAGIAIAGAVYHFATHSFSANSMGNASSFTASPPPETHINP